MKQVQKDFPVTNSYTYLNTAASGLLSESMLDWRQEHDLDFLIGGSIFREKQVSFFNGVKKTVADFFNGDWQQVALVQNFSWGFNALMEALPKTEKVLLIDTDYPSINWPVESRGFETVKVSITADLEEQIIQTIKSEKPTVFAFSIVQFTNGIKLAPSFLKQLKQEFPDLLLIADGTQYFGTEPFDFKDSGIDVIGASAYKWMLGGYGCGFFLFSEAATSRFEMKVTGMNAAAGNPNPGTLPLVNLLEPGHLDSLAFGSMQFGLEYLSELGLPAIQEHLNLLTDKAIKGFEELGLLEDVVLVRKDKHSTIFGLKLDEKYVSILREKDFLVSFRGTVRVSFHVYNTEKDVSKLLLALRNLKK
ncbi:Selenocysteine lyase/Cysteine desulfurase [Pustulibacterium marinum]|uniref:Selenocysteine lyase/Cysteine desulfurase n=1 Tax=Pustulibacterium marinum TaxID=1224947 RepID=A0A1I7GPW7_9FLAO|nr:aminotransferase class V-fold PLP-dependent enzyme [Pustulibacterium marinum]SFU50532.1 Selenocysteine lyase/Cysteine desulfurase [Pustulibacterium marinum]